MKKSYVFLLSGVAAVALSAVAYTAAPVIGSKTDSSMKPAYKATMADKMTRITKAPARNAEQVYNLPYNIIPTADQFAECDVMNGNEGNNWTYVNDDGVDCFKYTYNGSKAADAWVFLPTVHAPAGEMKVTWKDKTRNLNEQYKVYLCTGEDTETAIEVYDSGKFHTDQSWVDRLAVVNVAAEGDYRLAFYCCSEKNLWYVEINDVNIMSVNPNAPAVPTIAVDFLGEDGDIIVTAPNTTSSGGALSGNVNLEVTVDGVAAEGSPFTVTAGQPATINTHLDRGMHKITARASIVSGGETLYSENSIYEWKVRRHIPVPMSLPANIAPDEDEADLCTYFNLDNDNGEFKYVEQTDNGETYGTFRYNYTYGAAANDWIILPAMTASETGAYRMEFDLLTKYQAEGLELYVADAPTVEAMTATEPFFSFQSSTNDTWKTMHGDFTHAAGTFYIGMKATSPKDRSYMYLRNLVVKALSSLMPAVPQIASAEFDGSEGNVTFAFPEKTFSGQDYPVSTLNLVVSVDGEVYGETLTGAPGQQVTVPMNLERGDHTVSAYVTYTYNDVVYTSDPVSQALQITRPNSFHYDLPFTLAFSQEDFSDLLIIDANNDGKTWTYESGSAKYGYHGTNAADDWMITLPVAFTDAAKTYRVTIEAKSGSSYAEAFQMYIGTERNVESMTQMILDAPDFKESSYVEKTADFTVPAAGNYYIGIKATSKANMLNLNLKNLNIFVAPSALSPAAPTEVRAEAVAPLPFGYEGDIEATVYFTMPTVARDGSALPSNTYIDARIVDGTGWVKNVMGRPGEPKTFVVGAVQGDNTFSVTCSNSEGESETVTVSAWCGFDTPTTPSFSSVDLNESGCGLNLAWNAVTEGVHGLAIDANYRISEYDEDDYDWYAVEHTADLSYEYTVGDNTPQDFVKLGLEAYTSASTNSSMTQVEAACGKPLDCPVTDSFESGDATLQPVYSLSTSASAPTWNFAVPSMNVPDSGSDFYALVCSANAIGTNSGLVLPLISTQNAKTATFSLNAYIYSGTPKMEVYARTYGTERVLIGTINDPEETQAREGDGWNEFSFNLPAELLNRPWVEVMVYVYFSSLDQRAMVRSYGMSKTDITGVSDVMNGNVRVFAADGAVNIMGAEGMKVTVSDVSGKSIFAGEGRANMTLRTDKGVKIVTVNGRAYKLIVR